MSEQADHQLTKPIISPRPPTKSRKTVDHNAVLKALELRKAHAKQMLPLLREFKETFSSWPNDYSGGVIAKCLELEEVFEFWADEGGTDPRKDDADLPDEKP